MPAYLFDTDILSLHQRKHPRVQAAFASHATDVLCISTVTIEEQISGWSALARSARVPQKHEHAAMFLAALVVSWREFAVVPLTLAAIARFDAQVKAKLNVKRNDLRIAAIALELGATIVTRNRRDFGRVSGLIIEDWAT
jgi:tRNA(fMet)-specific endonuclease VapC